tara:strand:+ start:8188 stop:9885 length:1698 start_codon:yes stop_codon:yes gene_type:complete
MNILEVEDMIKGLPDMALRKEATQPTGRVPQFLVISEIKRRSDMRKRFQERQPQGTIKDQIVNEGIAAMAPPQPAMQSAMGVAPTIAMNGGGKTPYSDDPRIAYLQRMRDQGVTMEDVINRLQGLYVDTAGETSAPFQITDQSQSTVRPPNVMDVGSAVQNIPMTDLLRPGNPAYEALSTVYNEGMVSPQPTPSPQEMYDKNMGGFRNVVEDQPELYPFVQRSGQTGDVIKAVSSPSVDPSALVTTDGEPNNALTEDARTYSDIQSELRSKGLPSTTQADYSDSETVRRDALKYAESLKPYDYEQFRTDITSDFASLAPDYSRLIAKSEARAGQIRDDAKREAASQALIQLGAGIAAGNLASGLSKAGQTAADIRKEARKDITAEERLQQETEMSQMQTARQLGILDKQQAIKNEEQNRELQTKQYVANKTLEYQAAGLSQTAAENLAKGLESAALAGQAYTTEQRKFAIDRLFKEAQILRFQDLRSEEEQATVRSQLNFIEDTFNDAMEEWLKGEGAGAEPEEIKKYANSLVDSLVGSVGRATDELLGNDPKDPLGGVRDALKT